MQDLDRKQAVGYNSRRASLPESGIDLSAAKTVPVDSRV